MIGLGTIVNVGAIVVGGLTGLISKGFLKERFQETIIKAMGFAIIVMALGSTLSQMFTVEITESTEGFKGVFGTKGTMMLIVSLAVGALIGELLNLEKRLESFGTWLRDKTGNQGDNQFINAFITSSLTVCVGAMAIIGAIQDGVSADHGTLFAKAVLDLIIILMMTASLGKGCIFSAVPVALFQGTITLLAKQISPVMTESALSNISLVGNVLILCVGVNLIFPKTIRVANVLPAVVVAVLFAVW